MNFVNLYLETEYSMLESTIKLEELIEKCKRDKINTIAICDNSNIHGAFKFYNLCIKNGIKPIIGLQIALESKLGFYNSVLVYAKGVVGYKNLLSLATESKMSELVSFKSLERFSDDVICILPSDENEVVKLIYEDNYVDADSTISKYKSIYGGDLYLGVDMQTSRNKASVPRLVEFGNKHNVESVAINKTSFFEKEDYDVYSVLRAIDKGVKDYPKTEKEMNQYFISKEEINKLYIEFPNLLSNTEKISEKCNLELVYDEHYFPTFPDANGKSFEYLTQLCKLGLNKRLENLNVDVDEYKDRLFYELRIINEMGFSDYFLIVYDFVRYAKKNDILVGPGRGSAPGSLVAYCLGITDIDPIKYDLLFERFLNPERSTLPDIDIDFPDNKRDQVIEYVAKKYGRDKVASITTFGTYGPRLAIRDVIRVKDLSTNVANEILRHVSNNDKAINDVLNTKEEFRKLYDSNSEVAEVVRIVSKMEGLPRHKSTHAAGIIISSDSLLNYTALQPGFNGIMQTQFEANDLEDIGLIKMDFLGIRNLTIVDDVVMKIKVEEPEFNINNIPMDDKYTYRMISLGDTDGIFQLESAGMRKVLINLKTSNFMDIVNANALYRPGPMEMIGSFVNRKFGREKVDYIDPSLKEILEPTYGTIVFQEQIMLIAQKFAGYSLGMADILRRAVSKKDANILQAERERFVRSSVRENHSEAVANKVYDYIVKFANYGFNKSHSVAYSMIAYKMAYLKRHYYRYFMSTLMSYSVGSTNLIKNYINDCKKKKVVVNIPSINYSTEEFVVLNNEIYYSLLGIQSVGALSVEKIINERNENGLYKSYQDFVTRTKDFLNKRNIENLIHSGACDDFNQPRKQMVLEYENCLNIAKYNELLKDELLEKEFSDEEYTFEEISFYEREALGFNFKYSIFLKYQSIAREQRVIDISSLTVGRYKRTLFVINSIREILTKRNDEMAFLSVADDSGEIDVVCFPNEYRQFKNILEVNSVYIASGDVEVRNDKKQYVLKQISILK